eukprot:635302_1
MEDVHQPHRNQLVSQKQNQMGQRQTDRNYFVHIYCTFALLGIGRAFSIGVDPITRYILGLHVILLSIFGMILYCKFPAFDDVWCVRKEIRLSSFSVSVIAFSYIAAAAIFKLTPDSPYYVLLLYMAIGVTMFPILSSMLWVFRQFKLPWNIFSISSHRE